MALQMNFAISAGTNVASLQSDTIISTLIKTEATLVNGGYVKIENFNGDKNNLNIFVVYRVVKGDTVYFNGQIYTFPLDVRSTAKDPIKQGYDYLKTLSEFSDAIDILEEGQIA